MAALYGGPQSTNRVRNLGGGGAVWNCQDGEVRSLIPEPLKGGPRIAGQPDSGTDQKVVAEGGCRGPSLAGGPQIADAPDRVPEAGPRKMSCIERPHAADIIGELAAQERLRARADQRRNVRSHQDRARGTPRFSLAGSQVGDCR